MTQAGDEHVLWHLCKGLDEAAKLHFRESKLPIILAVITSLRCQQFSNISPAPTTKQDKYFHKRGWKESASASKVGRGGGGGLGERRGFSFPIPAPNSRVCLKGSAKNARKIMVCTENADQNIPERFRASEVIFKTFIAWL